MQNFGKKYCRNSKKNTMPRQGGGIYIAVNKDLMKLDVSFLLLPCFQCYYHYIIISK